MKCLWEVWKNHLLCWASVYPEELGLPITGVRVYRRTLSDSELPFSGLLENDFRDKSWGAVKVCGQRSSAGASWFHFALMNFPGWWQWKESVLMASTWIRCLPFMSRWSSVGPSRCQVLGLTSPTAIASAERGSCGVLWQWPCPCQDLRMPHTFATELHFSRHSHAYVCEMCCYENSVSWCKGRDGNTERKLTTATTKSHRNKKKY